MRLEQLKYIIEIADAGSISTAAENLHTSQPSISQSLVSLEKELDTVIFERSRFGTKPTEAGKIIIERARDILNQIMDINKIQQKEDAELTGSLTIAFIPSLGMTVLPKALGAFKKRHPKVIFKFYEEGSKLAIQKLHEGKIDLALVANLAGTQYEDNLNYIPLMTSEVKACVGRQSPYANMEEISLSEIIKHPIVAFNEKYHMHAYILSLLKPFGDPDILFTSENFEVAKQAVAENLAIGFYTNISIKIDPYFLTGAIVPLAIKDHHHARFSHGIVHKKNIHSTLAAQKFVEELIAQAKHFKRVYGLSD